MERQVAKRGLVLLALSLLLHLAVGVNLRTIRSSLNNAGGALEPSADSIPNTSAQICTPAFLYGLSSFFTTRDTSTQFVNDENDLCDLCSAIVKRGYLYANDAGYSEKWALTLRQNACQDMPDTRLKDCNSLATVVVQKYESFFTTDGSKFSDDELALETDALDTLLAQKSYSLCLSASCCREQHDDNTAANLLAPIPEADIRHELQELNTDRAEMQKKTLEQEELAVELAAEKKANDELEAALKVREIEVEQEATEIDQRTADLDAKEEELLEKETKLNELSDLLTNESPIAANALAQDVLDNAEEAAATAEATADATIAEEATEDVAAVETVASSDIRGDIATPAALQQTASSSTSTSTLSTETRDALKDTVDNFASINKEVDTSSTSQENTVPRSQDHSVADSSASSSSVVSETATVTPVEEPAPLAAAMDKFMSTEATTVEEAAVLSNALAKARADAKALAESQASEIAAQQEALDQAHAADQTPTLTPTQDDVAAANSASTASSTPAAQDTKTEQDPDQDEVVYYYYEEEDDGTLTPLNAADIQAALHTQEDPTDEAKQASN